MPFRPLFSAALVALFLPAAAVAESHADADTVVATVNGTEITLGHMIVLKQRLPAQYQQLPPEVLFTGILDQLVQQTLLGGTVETLSPGSVKSLDNEERALRASEAIGQIASEAVTDEAVAEAYARDFPGGQPEWDVSHILIEVAENADDETVAEAKARAEEVIVALNGGADFAELARERSEGPSAPNGGALGWYGEGALVSEFEEAMKALEPGQVSPEPVRTRFGFHVIQLHGTRQADAPPLDMVRPEIVERLQREAIDARSDELEAAAQIDTSGIEGIDPALLDDLSLLEN